MIISVRSAIAEDTDAVYGLLRTIADIHREARPDMFPDLVSKYTPDEVRERLSRSENGVFVAESDGSVIGYVFCDVIKEGRGTTLYIDDLCVDETCRGQHIGTFLYNYVKDFAKCEGCYNVTLNVWALNEGAIGFYKALGMKTQKIGMEEIL